MKYRAKVDIPPNVKAGDIVEVNEELVPGMKERLEVVSDDEELSELGVVDPENSDGEKTIITNPSRDELKARATELGINFASNIPTERLIELVGEAEAKAKTENENQE